LFAVDPDHPLADLPVAQLRVCGLLFQRGARTMSQVGEELSISLSAVTQLADRLERAGLVARTAESAPGCDRRTKRLCLTPHGETLMQSRRALRLRRTEQALRRLSGEQRRAVLDALETLLDAPPHRGRRCPNAVTPKGPLMAAAPTTTRDPPPPGGDASGTAAKPPNPFYALRFRNFRLFFFGQMVSVAGTWMQIVAQQWLVFSLTHSAAWLGIVTGASAIPSVALTLYGGQIADRVPRRRILLVTQTASMILAVVLAVLATNRLLPIQAWHIALLAGLSGVVNAFNMPAQQSFVADMVEDRKVLGNAIALNSIQFNVARFVGPVAAGPFLSRSGRRAVSL
jgi:DNA-binding MarR family transcriptional regulator